MALPYDINANRTYVGSEQAKAIAKDVAAGRRTMGLICSDPGYRKSYETKHYLRIQKVPYHECAPSTESALVRVLWGIESGSILYKGRKPAVMVADDQDGMWQRPTIANQMKCVLGSDRRCVIFETPEALKNEDRKNSGNERERAKYKATIAPPTFPTLIRMICLANLNYTDPAVVAGLSDHFRALVSKGLDPHWIPNDAENDGREVFLWTHWQATVGGSLRSEGYPYPVAQSAVKIYVENVHRLIDIPPRRLSLIAHTILHNPGPVEREKALGRMLRDTDQRPKLKVPEPWIQVMLWPSDPPKGHADPPTPDSIVPPPADDEPIVPDPPDPPPIPDSIVPPVADEPPIVPAAADDAPIVPPADPLAATLDAELPGDMDERVGAFWGVVPQIESLGEGLMIWEATQFIKSAKPDVAKRLFSYLTTRAIIEAARAEIARPRAHDDGKDDDTANDDGKVDEKPNPLTVKIAEVMLEKSVEEIEARYDMNYIKYTRHDVLQTRAAICQLLGLLDDSDRVDRALARLKHKDSKYFRGIINQPDTTTLAQVLDDLET